ncbi:hypothetical protein, partial [Alishewanella longhuensis]
NHTIVREAIGNPHIWTTAAKRPKPPRITVLSSPRQLKPKRGIHNILTVHIFCINNAITLLKLGI